MNENFKCDPKTTYAARKFACDILIKTYSDLYNLDTVIIRPSNIYGPRQFNKNKIFYSKKRLGDVFYHKLNNKKFYLIDFKI